MNNNEYGKSFSLRHVLGVTLPCTKAQEQGETMGFLRWVFLFALTCVSATTYAETDSRGPDVSPPITQAFPWIAAEVTQSTDAILLAATQTPQPVAPKSPSSTVPKPVTAPVAPVAPPVPQIASVTPPQLPTSTQLQAITINGSGFDSGTRVELMYGVGPGAGRWNTPQHGYQVLSSSQIRAGVLTGADADQLRIRVTNSRGSSNQASVGIVKAAPAPVAQPSLTPKPTPTPLRISTLSTNMAGTTPQTLPQTSTPAQLPHTVTYCGSKWYQQLGLQLVEVEQALRGGYSFDAACQAHDACYGDRDCRTQKADCDKKLHADAEGACQSARNRANCIADAQIFFQAVSAKGDNPFRQARAHCPSTLFPSNTTGTTPQTSKPAPQPAPVMALVAQPSPPLKPSLTPPKTSTLSTNTAAAIPVPAPAPKPAPSPMPSSGLMPAAQQLLDNAKNSPILKKLPSPALTRIDPASQMHVSRYGSADMGAQSGVRTSASGTAMDTRIRTSTPPLLPTAAKSMNSDKWIEVASNAAPEITKRFIQEGISTLSAKIISDAIVYVGTHALSEEVAKRILLSPRGAIGWAARITGRELNRDLMHADAFGLMLSVVTEGLVDFIREPGNWTSNQYYVEGAVLLIRETTLAYAAARGGMPAAIAAQSIITGTTIVEAVQATRDLIRINRTNEELDARNAIGNRFLRLRADFKAATDQNQKMAMLQKLDEFLHVEGSMLLEGRGDIRRQEYISKLARANGLEYHPTASSTPSNKSFRMN